ncbi:MAG: hypothetical protein KME11_19110 [Timaviella obliquedivisa GSE-PSE-MK23-08B]|nr:hypothetical protein [Timaviella obliquedivisa GSE-PSE-MK23-08B]
MSQETTFTTLQHTVNLIGGLYGMVAVARFGLGFGLGSLVQNVARFGSILSVDRQDLTLESNSICGLKPVGLPQDTMPKQRSGKCRFKFSVLTLD